MIKTKEKLYFAYGSNMNLNQMAFRCPDAEVVESVRLEGYRLAFRTNGGGNGVATILPEEGSYVDGVLWRISERDEQHLDHYEGFPFLYGKEPVTVTNQDGVRREIMAYTMNSPYKDKPNSQKQELNIYYKSHVLYHIESRISFLHNSSSLHQCVHINIPRALPWAIRLKPYRLNLQNHTVRGS